MIFASYLSLLVFGLLDNFRGPFFTSQLNSFSLSESLGAAFFGITSVFASLSAASGGVFLRRFGVMGLMNLSSLMMAAGFAVMAFSPSLELMLLGAALFGCGLGLASVAQNVAVSEYAPMARRSQLMSGLHAMYALASAVSPWVAHELLMRGLTWRQSFAGVACVPAAFAVAGYVWQFRLRAQPLEAAKLELSKRLWPKGMRNHVLLLALATAVYLMAEISIGTRLVRWLEVVHQIDAAKGALYLMTFFIMMFVGRALTWKWAPNSATGLYRMLLASLIAGLLSLLAALWWWPPLVALTGLALGPFYPLAMTYARVRFHVYAPQAFTRVIAMGSAVVVTMHFLIGWSADTYGLQMAMQIGPVGLVMALAILTYESRMVQP